MSRGLFGNYKAALAFAGATVGLAVMASFGAGSLLPDTRGDERFRPPPVSQPPSSARKNDLPTMSRAEFRASQTRQREQEVTWADEDLAEDWAADDADWAAEGDDWGEDNASSRRSSRSRSRSRRSRSNGDWGEGTEQPAG